MADGSRRLGAVSNGNADQVLALNCCSSGAIAVVALAVSTKPIPRCDPGKRAHVGHSRRFAMPMSLNAASGKVESGMMIPLVPAAMVLDTIALL